ncbi:MAG: AraC family transcriptional regulator [Clostridia bacterium]|jgi:AraC-like DNA-binding protein|uniref:AraC family transcriptional regulator n=1 Tax=Pumilibacter muris TaxID=2941510 RepID=UPI0020420347|nr:AraC family transcriptional regulator [Pumilibacter muris]MCI8596211.1 AraC family transcriptional regulator [Clostridia bacterium]
MSFNIAMFDSKVNIVVVESEGYGSIVPHSHEFVELVYVKSGEGENIIGEKKIPVKQGDLFLLADRELSHSIFPFGNPADFTVWNIIFPFDFYNYNYALISPETVVPLEKIKDGEYLINRIKEEYENKNWMYEEITYGLTGALLAELFRAQPSRRGKANREQSRQKYMSEYIDVALDYIHKNYDKQISVNDVAAACGVCKPYLQRIFKRERNTSVVAYIIKYRIEQSCRYLLNTNYSVATISQMVGFNDLKYFHMKFKELVGDTPNKYKQNVEREC